MSTSKKSERRRTTNIAWDLATSPRLLALTVMGTAISTAIDVMEPGLVPSPMVRFSSLAALAVSGLLCVRLLVGASDWTRGFRREMAAAGWLHEVSVPFFVEELASGKRPNFKQAQARSPRLAHVALALLVASVAFVPALWVGARYLGVPEYGVAELRPNTTLESMAIEQDGRAVERRLDIQLTLIGSATRPDDTFAVVRVRDPRDGRSTDVEVRPDDRTRVGNYYVSLESFFRTPEPGGAFLRMREGDTLSEFELSVGAQTETPSGGTLILHQVQTSYLNLLGPAARVELLDSAGTRLRYGWVFAEMGDFEENHREGPRFELVGLAPETGATISVSERGRYAGPALALLLGWLVVLGMSLIFSVLAKPRIRGRNGDWVLVILGPLPEAWAHERTAAWIHEYFGQEAAREWRSLIEKIEGGRRP